MEKEPPHAMDTVSRNLVDNKQDDGPDISMSPSMPPINSPATPVIGRRSSSPGNRDYKNLFLDVKLRAEEYTKKTEAELAAQRNEISELKSSYEDIIAKKDEEIATLVRKMKEVELDRPKFTRTTDEEIFMTKAKKRKCQFPECANDKEDALIKCNACGIWICESCHHIPISKLKPIMNKCTSVFVACKKCEDSLNNGTESNSTNTGASETVRNLSEQLCILQTNEAALRDLLQEREEELDKVHTKLNAAEDSAVSDAVLRENAQLTEEKNKLERELSNQKAEMKKINNEKSSYNRERLELNQTVNTLRKEKVNSQTTLTAQEGIIQLLRQKNAACENKDDSSGDPVSLDSKLETFSEKLLTKVTQIVDEKLSKLSSNTGTLYADIARENNNQTPAVATPPADFAKIMRENKNEELVEEQEKQRRANNIIVYGIKEDQEDASVTQKTKDDRFITGLMEVLELDVKPTGIIRIGKFNMGKSRPIKLTMSSAADKKSVMENLKRLKDADEVYRCLSIRDDYTLKERELINKYAQEAKEKNEADNTNEWKVRGTPKNGLRVVRITKRQ